MARIRVVTPNFIAYRGLCNSNPAVAALQFFLGWGRASPWGAEWLHGGSWPEGTLASHGTSSSQGGISQAPQLPTIHS